MSSAYETLPQDVYENETPYFFKDSSEKVRKHISILLVASLTSHLLLRSYMTTFLAVS